MKNFAFFLLMVTFTTVINAQTWLEKSMNGLSYGSMEPDTSANPNLYSEPIDTTWRFGNTGIGTPVWPKVKLQVHSGVWVDNGLDDLVLMYGGYSNFNAIFSRTGTGEPNTTPNSIFGLSANGDDPNGGSNSILGMSFGENTKTVHGIIGVGNGENVSENYGITGHANGENNEQNVGVHGLGVGNNNENYGVIGQCNSTDPNSVNIGVRGRGILDGDGEQALVNVGVHGRANCGDTEKGTQFNCGVYGQNIGCVDSTYGGANFPTGSYAGYFDGNVLITGWMSSLSDRRLKENVKSIEGALDKLKKVNVYSYNYKQGVGLSLSNSLSYGVIADELEKEFPELVKNVNVINHRDPKNYRNIETYKSVNYQEMIPILLQAVKELNDKIDALDPEKSASTLKSLKGEIDQLNGNLKQVAVTSNLQSTSTLKAYPNPSQSDVTIEIDQVSCNDCWLLITDLSGKIILQQPVHQSYEKIVLSKGKLGSGIYQCNLVENGNVINSVKIALLQ